MVSNRLAREVQKWDVDSVPLSEVMASGMPNLPIHLWGRTSAPAQNCVLAQVTGIALSHLAEQSIIVNK